jgi:hypothetical protein
VTAADRADDHDYIDYVQTDPLVGENTYYMALLKSLEKPSPARWGRRRDVLLSLALLLAVCAWGTSMPEYRMLHPPRRVPSSRRTRGRMDLQARHLDIISRSHLLDPCDVMLSLLPLAAPSSGRAAIEGGGQSPLAYA